MDSRGVLRLDTHFDDSSVCPVGSWLKSQKSFPIFVLSFFGKLASDLLMLDYCFLESVA